MTFVLRVRWPTISGWQIGKPCFVVVVGGGVLWVPLAKKKKKRKKKEKRKIVQFTHLTLVPLFGPELDPQLRFISKINKNKNKTKLNNSKQNKNKKQTNKQNKQKEKEKQKKKKFTSESIFTTFVLKPVRKLYFMLRTPKICHFVLGAVLASVEILLPTPIQRCRCPWSTEEWKL